MTACPGERENPSAVRQDLLIIGVGNPLRGDDRVGFEVVTRLREALGPALQTLEVQEPDIVLAERLAGFREAVIVDAMRVPEHGEKDGRASFRIVELCSGFPGPSGGFTSHVFDWWLILALAKEVFGHAPKASVLGVPAVSFEFTEFLSTACAHCAEEVLGFLTHYCKEEKEEKKGDKETKGLAASESNSI